MRVHTYVDLRIDSSNSAASMLELPAYISTPLLELRRRSITRCNHGLRNRGIGCSSLESLQLSPSYMSEIMGNSTYIEHKQSALKDASACQAYFVIRSCIDLGLTPYASNDHTSVTIISPFASVYSDEIYSMFEMRDTSGTQDTSSYGLIIYRNTSDSRFNDHLEQLLSTAYDRCKNPLWWIIPVMRSEVYRCRRSLTKFSRSKILLPIGSGPKSEMLCLVGHRDHPQGVEIWDEISNSKLGWYNSYVRTMRVAPDICRDCWMILRYFNPKVSEE